jgi:hypothetical protein
MKKFFMAIVLCLVCTVSFGQDRVNRVNPTYESEGYVLKDIIGWGYNEQLGQWRGYPNVIWTWDEEYDNSSWDKSISDDIISLQIKTITINDTLYYVLVREHYCGRYKYPEIHVDWYYFITKDLMLLTIDDIRKLRNIQNEPTTICAITATMNSRNADKNEVNYILKELREKDFLQDKDYITIYQATDGSIRFIFGSYLPYNYEKHQDDEHLDMEKSYFEITEEDYLKFINIQ